MADLQKDTIYVDIDDEITSIIDKVQASSAKVVALVLPKRATTLQSIVNMKLLKRAGEQGNKNLVLVTTESGLMPLAGAVGMHVAATPNSRPEIPAAPGADGDDPRLDEVDLDEDIAEPLTIENAADKPVGELAGAAAMPVATKPTADSGVETLQLDNTDEPVTKPAKAAAAGAAVAAKPKKDKSLHVPNFDRFRVLLIAGVAALIILIGLGYVAFAVLPKATIDIKTNASNVNTDVDFTLSTNAKSFSESSKTVPAKQVQVQKTLSGSAPATGQKNNGDKARGSVTMTLCTASPAATGRIASGTGISSGGKTYITQENADFQYLGSCNNGFRFRASDVDITAQSGGASFNVNDATFSISGRSDINATGSATGGTDDIQTVVNQSDIDAAKAKIASSAADSVQGELQKQLEEDDFYAITTTYAAGEPATTASSSVGDEASNVTVTQTITYTMLGARQENIKTLVEADIKGQIDTGEQGILSDGITQNAFKVTATNANGAAMNIQTTGIVGPSLDTQGIAEQAAGKKAGEIKSTISGVTGVTDVEVKLSPFWVGKAPKKTDKITVTIAKPTNTAR